MAIYALIEEGNEFDKVEAESADAALESYDLDTSCYDASDGTIWVRIHARNVDDSRDKSSLRIRIDPKMPRCSAKSHEWQSPHAILGGLKENPGVWGHGGGVIIREVCMHCGCERTTDTWAQDPSTGEQGLESVRYEPGKYADEIAAREAL